MKVLLACLMSLVLPVSECFALKGGPPTPGGTISTTGIYAGVLYPIGRANSIGLFTVSVPRSGLGAGTVFLFANQSAYNGTMQATADPDTAAFTGFIDAGFGFVRAECTAACSDPDPSKRTITILSLRAVASGRIDAEVLASQNTLSRSSARLSGTAFLQFNPDFLGVRGIDYQLVGFKQTEL